MVLVDGAHALGHIPVNVTDIDAEFYVSNGHKWLYSPKGSAILWVKKEYQVEWRVWALESACPNALVQNIIHPTTISREGQGPTFFQSEFSYQGTSDMTAYMSMADALRWRARLGDREIMEYIHQLALRGGQILADKWGTDILGGVAPSHRYIHTV